MQPMFVPLFSFTTFSRCVHGAATRLGWDQFSYPHQIVDRSQDFHLLSDLPASNVAAASQSAHGLNPAKAFFYFLTTALTHLIGNAVQAFSHSTACVHFDASERSHMLPLRDAFPIASDVLFSATASIAARRPRGPTIRVRRSVRRFAIGLPSRVRRGFV